MEVVVWDTHVKRPGGLTMHFDILVSADVGASKVYHYGKQYLTTKSFETGELNAMQCKFCHIEMASETLKDKIAKNEYHIVEMANCD